MRCAWITSWASVPGTRAATSTFITSSSRGGEVKSGGVRSQAASASAPRGVAAVVVTHDAQLAAWADRVVFLRDGRVTGQTARPPGPESLLTPEEIR